MQLHTVHSYDNYLNTMRSDYCYKSVARAQVSASEIESVNSNILAKLHCLGQ